MSEILVTGATGFVGRHIVRALALKGKRVRCLVHRPRMASVIKAYEPQLFYGDILDPSSLREAFQDVETVIHLVAIIREKGDQTFRRVNHQGTRNVVEAAKLAQVKRIVHLSALGARNDPRFPYLYSKWQGEQEVIRSGIPYVILRPSLLFGDGDEFFNILAGLVKALPVVPIAGDGQARFQPVAVEDVARCVVLALEKEEVLNRVIEVGGPHHLTYNQMVDMVGQTLGLRRVKVHIPLPLMRLLVRLVELVLPKPLATRHQLDMLRIDNTTDLDSVEREFGFKPRPLQGNLEYLLKITFSDAFRIALGSIPAHIRDH